MAIRRIGPEEVALVRDLRLRALSDAPGAFGSSYEREVAFTDDVWAGRLRPEGNPHFVFEDESGGAAGTVVVAQAEDDPSVSYLLGMWVDPAARGNGVGDALVDGVLTWVRTAGGRSVRLFVIEGNAPAERLYRRHGFVETARRFVRERDGAVEVEMETPVDGPSPA